jgi:hypothetical protein
MDSRETDLRCLRDEGLTRSVSLAGRDRVVTLTKRGHHLLEAHRRDGDDAREQSFHAGVSRPRELFHDAQLYRAYLREEERLRDQGAEVHRVILDQELKREYQEWLQESNRGRPDSDGRPDRDPLEIERWAHEHDLPYFDEQVHFPDFRIEYELDGRDRHEDVEVVTEHYRGALARSVARAGFRCYGSRSQDHRKSSAKPGSNPRAPLRPLIEPSTFVRSDRSFRELFGAALDGFFRSIRTQFAHELKMVSEHGVTTL